MLITEQSLVERLDGRARDPRRRCRLFIPHQAVFIPNQLLFSPRLVCSHPADRWPGEAGDPAAGVKGITAEWKCRRTASQPEGLPTALLRPRRLAPTAQRQRWPDPYPQRLRAAPAPMPPMPEPSPTDWAAPDSLTAVLTARVSSGRAARREELGKHADRQSRCRGRRKRRIGGRGREAWPRRRRGCTRRRRRRGPRISAS
jgi:hypothetical protein